MKQSRGKFIVFEGIDGAGKTTQIGLLEQYLKTKGIPAVTTAEPTDLPEGKLLRRAPGQHLAQGLRQRGTTPEFEAQQGLPHRTLVPEGRGAGQVLFREGHLLLRDPGQGLFARRADAHRVQNFPAEGAFRRKEQVDEGFKKSVHFFFRG